MARLCEERRAHRGRRVREPRPAGGLRPARAPGDRRARQDRPRAPLQGLPGRKEPGSRAARRGRPRHLLRPRGRRLRPGRRLSARAVGQRQPRAARRQRLRLHRARRPAHPWLAVGGGGPAHPGDGVPHPAPDPQPAPLLPRRPSGPRSAGRTGASPPRVAGGRPLRLPRGPRAGAAASACRRPARDRDDPRRDRTRARSRSRPGGRRPDRPALEPSRRLGLRRGRPFLRHRHRARGGPLAGRAGPARPAAPPHDRARDLGRGGVHADRLHGVGRGACRGAGAPGGRLPERRRLDFRRPALGQRGPLAPAAALRGGAEPARSQGAGHLVRRVARRRGRQRARVRCRGRGAHRGSAGADPGQRQRLHGVLQPYRRALGRPRIRRPLRRLPLHLRHARVDAPDRRPRLPLPRGHGPAVGPARSPARRRGRAALRLRGVRPRPRRLPRRRGRPRPVARHRARARPRAPRRPGAGAAGGPEPTGDAAADTERNRALLQAERDLLAPEGIPDRPWFRHLVYAPLPSYEAETLPGVREAVLSGDAARARDQATRLAEALERAARTLGATPP